ncbi:MAG: HEAT repeat domain-containing protein [Labilithrix sp.]|nr:HEAT repeat domain-containing protein [Labilithrix sp.]MCW5810712.1 HEAT repeat domain-containing protein [Labilithrix sp.]
MRGHRRLFALIGLSLALVAPVAHGQDFDPRGRHKPKPGPAKPGPGKPGPAKPGPAKPGPTNPDVGQSQTVLIERYTKIVLSQPGSPFPLQRLAQLYRDKDGNLNNLVKDLETRAAQAGAEQYAATVSLAGVYKIDGRADDAVKTYEKAIGLKNTDPVALLAFARLLQDRGDVAAARKRYEEALALQTVPADKEQTVRTLMTLALDAKDWAAAKGFHAQLVKMQPTSLFVKGELARELYQRAEYDRSEAEFKELVAASQGDNRALAPALKDLGKAQAKAHKNQEALATLKKALQSAGQEAAVRAEIYETISEIYRADQQLPILIKQLEDEHPTDFQRLALLGALYEETGDSAKALQTYAKALAVNPRQIDLRLKMIRVLQSQGELDKAITEYEALIRAAPNNPQFVFDQCEALMQRGDRTRAMKLLVELEARGQNDEEVLSRLADFYGRIGENERSLKVLTRIVGINTNDPGHLVDLGDRYFQDGNQQLAVQTWKRILTTITPRARALSALGEVYMEHDMLADALQSFREATQLEPSNVGYKKQLASALERSKSYKEARVLWQELAEKAKATNDKLLARESRSRIVTLWGFEHVLDSQIAPLKAKFEGKPPDVEAGRMLAEVQLHLRTHLAESEQTLRRVIELAPGDTESYLALERVLVQENKIADAIVVLEKLIAVDPKSARQLYQRMADYAISLYRDEDAIKYAARAVELNPDDAEGHHKLGMRYRQRGDIEHAILEFRAAIAKNDRLFPVYLELADLLLSKGQTDEADRLFRRVLRGAPDEELVSRAARLSMQINLGKGTLESLEQELLPLAIGNPQKKIYRRLLVEIYGNLTFALVQRVRHGSGKDAEDAKAALARIGGRAVKPLLDALADGDAGQQRIAIDVLGYVQNKNASTALFTFATGQGEGPLRTRAMLACGALKDPALLPKYEGLLFPREGGGDAMASDTVARAASWAVARLGDRRAIPLLKRVAQKGSPDMRAFAVLGLGALKDKPSVPIVAQTAKSLEAGGAARAAAAYALGEMDATSEVTSLVTIAEDSDPLPRQMALLAIGRMSARAGKAEALGGKASLHAMTDAVFAGEGESARARRSSDSLRQAATAALVMVATKTAGDGLSAGVPAPDDDVEAETTLDQLVPKNLPAKDRAAALVAFSESLERSATGALATSTERARAVLDAMGTREGTLEPFLFAAEDTPDLAAARAKVKAISAAIEPSVVALSRHPDPSVRMKAIVLLARSKSEAASSAIARAVTDSSDAVQRVALSSIGTSAERRPDTAAVAAASKVMRSHESWAMRVLAAQALGRLGGAEATKALKEAATKEPYALVREAALVALSSYDKNEAAALATQMATHDAEPRVRETATRIRSR